MTFQQYLSHSNPAKLGVGSVVLTGDEPGVVIDRSDPMGMLWFVITIEHLGKVLVEEYRLNRETGLLIVKYSGESSIYAYQPALITIAQADQKKMRSSIENVIEKLAVALGDAGYGDYLDMTSEQRFLNDLREQLLADLPRRVVNLE